MLLIWLYFIFYGIHLAAKPKYVESIWSNLAVPYPESTHLHKQSLEILSTSPIPWVLQDILCLSVYEDGLTSVYVLLKS